MNLIEQSNDLKDNLQWFADAGYTVIPLSERGDKRIDGTRPILDMPGKIPLSGDWQHSSYEPFPKVEKFKNNYGICLQADDIVIDVDPRNFQNGVDSFALLLQNIPELGTDRTLTTKTGGGGFHLFYKKDPSFPIRGGLKEYPGIEFKTKGQQVVGAGSIHPDTKNPYELVRKCDPIKAPELLLELIQRHLIDLNDKKEGTNEYMDDDQTCQRFSDYLSSTDIAVEGQNGDKRTFTVIAKGRDLGLSSDKCFELVCSIYNPRCSPPWATDELRRKVLNAYKYASNAVGCASPTIAFKNIKGIPDEHLAWDDTASGKRSKTLRNTVNLFVREGSPLLGLLAFNDFSQDITFTRMPPWKKTGKVGVWNDEEAINCKNWMANELVFEPKTQDLHDAALVVSQNNSYHPVKQYLEGLKWDGHSRISRWVVKYLGAEDNAYTRAVGMKILVAAVKRIYEPGCDFHYIPILEGKQGSGKSRTVRVLAEPWFSDQSLDVTNKDTIDAMRGQWIIEFSEMESHRKSEDQAMKAFLSRPTDRARLAYMRCSKDYPRQCIFIGTFNPESDSDVGYLKDTTGNRRYWPILTDVIDIDSLRAVRDQLWAEALALYRQGTPIYLEDAGINELATAEQKKRMGRDAWFSRIATWLVEDPIWKDRPVVTQGDIYVECIGGRIAGMGRREQLRLNTVMEDLRWEKGSFYQIWSKQVVRGYRRPLIE